MYSSDELVWLQAADGGVDPYVVFQLDDPKKVKPEIQASSHMTNEPAPHWNTKFDFALISATSTLRLHVYDKKSTMQNVMSHPVKMLTGKVTGNISDSPTALFLHLKCVECLKSIR